MFLYSVKLRGLIGLLTLFLFVSGCVATRKQPVTPAGQSSAGAVRKADSRWWQIRLVFQWPEASEPALHLDLLVAHRVMAPALKKYNEHLYLWRFHRRAVRDATGHQFSLIFYTDREISENLYNEIKTD